MKNLTLPPSMKGISLQHSRTLTSAVTTAWGVDWDEVYIARDILQNFFDANREHLSKVVSQRSKSNSMVWSESGAMKEKRAFRSISRNLAS